MGQSSLGIINSEINIDFYVETLVLGIKITNDSITISGVNYFIY